MIHIIKPMPDFTVQGSTAYKRKVAKYKRIWKQINVSLSGSNKFREEAGSIEEAIDLLTIYQSTL